MTQRLIILLTIILVCISCQDEEIDNNILEPAVATDADAVPVTFSMSLKTSLESSTEYIPMKAGSEMQDEEKYQITISNIYKVYIVKKIGSKWILDKSLKLNIQPPKGQYDYTTHKIKNGVPVASFTTDLRPGEYRAVIITGEKAVEWNNNLIQGDIIDEEGNSAFTVPLACYYRPIEEGYSNVGTYGLQEEIFSGYQDFTVKKTEDLHSDSQIQEVKMSLSRKVGKIRVLLDNKIPNDGTYSFDNGNENAISFEMNTKNDIEFPIGLNVWGNHYYSPDTTLTSMTYSGYCDTRKISINESFYFVPKSGTRQLDVYYFINPQQDIPVTVSNINVTFDASQPTLVSYDNPELTIKNNYITGFVLGLGTEEYTTNSKTYWSIHVLFENNKAIDPTDWLDYNIEYR